MEVVWLSGSRGMPNLAASCSDFLEEATPCICKPSKTCSPNSMIIRADVDPEPRPTTMPFSIYDMAFLAAFNFSVAASIVWCIDD